MAEAIEKRISELARRQRGYVLRCQLLELGLGRRAIGYRITTGRLIQVYHGVYAVGHLPSLPQDRAYAAVLACGTNAVLSHGSAATLYGIYRWWDLPFEVTTPAKRSIDGIRRHRAKLRRRDLATHLGLPVTSPARTALDMARRLTDRQLRRAYNKLRLEHDMTEEQVRDVVARFRTHRGATRLARLITGRGATASGIEDKFADFCERHGLPEPLLNQKIDGRQVDAYFPEHRLIVEIDSYPTHSGPVSFEDDRDRDASMLALGLATVRVTEERIDNEPEREAARLRAILEQRLAA